MLLNTDPHTITGLASLTYGVGVFSFARYTDTFYRTPPDKDSTENYKCSEVTAKLLWRACKVSFYQICVVISAAIGRMTG